MNWDDEDIQAAYFCAAEVLRTRHRTGKPVPAGVRRFYARVDLAIECMSPSGHEIDGTAAQLNQDELLTTRETATILNKSPRQTRRIAPDLEAQIIGGRLLFPRSAVETYAASERQNA